MLTNFMRFKNHSQLITAKFYLLFFSYYINTLVILILLYSNINNINVNGIFGISNN